MGVCSQDFYQNVRDLSGNKYNKVKKNPEKNKNLTKISKNRASEIKPLMKDFSSLKRYIAEIKASTQEIEKEKMRTILFLMIEVPSLGATEKGKSLTHM